MSDPQFPAIVGDGDSGASAKGWHRIESYFICPKRYQFEQVRRITKPRSGRPPYFLVGSMVHAGRAAWLTGQDVAAALRKTVEASEAETGVPTHPDVIRLAQTYVDQYIDFWSLRPKPKTVATEYTVMADLEDFHRPGGDTDWSTRTARLDDVSYYPEGGGKLWLGECKTTSTDIGTTVLEYQQHGQPMLQQLLWERAANGEALFGKVAGVMLDVVKKGYDGRKSEFARIPLEFTEHQLDWFQVELLKALEHAETMEWEDRWIDRNIANCSRMIGNRRVACPYAELCKYGRDAELEYCFEGGGRLSDVVKQDPMGASVYAWD